MVTAKQVSFGLLVLLLVTLLIVMAALYWHHMTGVSVAHLLAWGRYPPGGGEGC